MKKSIAAILAGALCLSALTACGGGTSSSDSSAAANTGDSDKVITVGATPTPHAEILNAAKDALEAEGYTLKVVEFTDYVQPNTALVDGDRSKPARTATAPPLSASRIPASASPRRTRSVFSSASTA